MNFWRIIPGENKPYRSTILGKFIRENYISIGWNPVRDLTNVSENDLEPVCRDDLQGWEERFISAGIKAFRLFRYRMEIGDLVVVSGDGVVYAVGKIVSSYYKREEPTPMPEGVYDLGFWSYYHRRDVAWIKIMKVPLSRFPDDIAKKLGTPPALIKLSSDEWLILSSALLRTT